MEKYGSLEVITFGEALVIFNPQKPGPLRYVDSFYKSIGGAEANLAIALSRLGHRVGWFSKLGNDEFGRYVTNALLGEGIDLSRITLDNERPTGILFKERFGGENPNVYYYRKNSAASALQINDIDFEYIKSSKILHISGITPAISNNLKDLVIKVVDFAKENNITISFDPNIRLKLWTIDEAKPVLNYLMQKADIVFPGIDEAKILLGTSDPEEVGNILMANGCKIAAVKLGKEGCYVRDSSGGQYVEGFKVNTVIDTVGAGDGFAAGFLSGVLEGFSSKDCALQANAVGAMATMVEGDSEGYPLPHQLSAFINKNNIDR